MFMEDFEINLVSELLHQVAPTRRLEVITNAAKLLEEEEQEEKLSRKKQQKQQKFEGSINSKNKKMFNNTNPEISTNSDDNNNDTPSQEQQDQQGLSSYLFGSFNPEQQPRQKKLTFAQSARSEDDETEKEKPSVIPVKSKNSAFTAQRLQMIEENNDHINNNGDPFNNYDNYDDPNNNNNNNTQNQEVDEETREKLNRREIIRKIELETEQILRSRQYRTYSPKSTARSKQGQRKTDGSDDEEDEDDDYYDDDDDDDYSDDTDELVEQLVLGEFDHDDDDHHHQHR